MIEPATIRVAVENQTYQNHGSSRDGAVAVLDSTFRYMPPANVSGKLCELSVDRFLLFVDPQQYNLDSQPGYNLSIPNWTQTRGSRFKDEFFDTVTTIVGNCEFALQHVENGTIVFEIEDTEYSYTVPPGSYNSASFANTLDDLIAECGLRCEKQTFNVMKFYNQVSTPFKIKRAGTTLWTQFGWSATDYADKVSDASFSIRTNQPGNPSYKIEEGDPEPSTYMIYPGTYTYQTLASHISALISGYYTFTTILDTTGVRFRFASTLGSFQTVSSLSTALATLGFEATQNTESDKVYRIIGSGLPVDTIFTIIGPDSTETRETIVSVQRGNDVITSGFLNSASQVERAKPVLVHIPDGPQDVTFRLTRQSTSDDDHAHYITVNDGGDFGTEVTPAYEAQISLVEYKGDSHHENLRSYSTGPNIRV